MAQRRCSTIRISYLDDATAAQAASANDAHTDKGPLYELIAHHYLSSEHSNFEWLIASELCTRHGEKLSAAGAWGKALRQHANDGNIESRKGRSNQTQYRLPIVNPKMMGKIDKK